MKNIVKKNKKSLVFTYILFSHILRRNLYVKCMSLATWWGFCFSSYYTINIVSGDAQTLDAEGSEEKKD